MADVKKSSPWLRWFAILIFIGGIAMWYPPVVNQFKALISFYGPRTALPAEGITTHFKKLKDHDAGTYFLYEPEDTSAPKPLVIAFHGAPGRAYAAKFLAIENLYGRYSSYILIPTIPWNAHWATPQSHSKGDEPIDNIAHLISSMKNAYNIDPKRIYIIGCSEGGAAVFAAIERYPELFAAAVSISGAWPAKHIQNIIKTPLWVMVGKHDTVVPPQYAHGLAREIKAYGGDVKFTSKPNFGHNCPAIEYYSHETWNWLFKHTKG